MEGLLILIAFYAILLSTLVYCMVVHKKHGLGKVAWLLWVLNVFSYLLFVAFTGSSKDWWIYAILFHAAGNIMFRSLYHFLKESANGNRKLRIICNTLDNIIRDNSRDLGSG